MNELEKTLNGTDLFGGAIEQKLRGPVAERFGFPPFSILDARSGEWQDRKRAWGSIGIKSEVGRDLSLTHQIPLIAYNAENKEEEYYGEEAQRLNTSIFDPVLCECLYRWFCPEGGQVIDPFAGGSVRGIIAGMLGRKYWGCELRREQVESNREQAAEINPYAKPVWHCGYSQVSMWLAPKADFIFSCPPYGDLEVYSDDPSDLSNMEFEKFKSAYWAIIWDACKKLRENRFAAFVVGDYRDEVGNYRNFVGQTVGAFLAAGLHLYNEGILVSPVGSASMRVNRQFSAGRKFVKTHQNVLVFVKGDGRKAAEAMK